VVKLAFWFALMALDARAGLVATVTVGEHSALLITHICAPKQVSRLKGRTLGVQRTVARLEACAHALRHSHRLAPGLKATVVKLAFWFALMALDARAGLVATVTVGELSALLITHICAPKQVSRLKGRTLGVTQRVAPGAVCAHAQFKLEKLCRCDRHYWWSKRKSPV